MFIDSVAFALLIFRRVDAALRAYGMRSLHRHNRKQLDRDSRFRNAYRRHQSGQTTANNYDLWLSHLFGR